jgi:outer membrane protein
MMSENKNGALVISIITGFIILAAAVYFAISASAFKVASVDMDKVIEKSELGKQINKELQNKGKELQGKIELVKDDKDKAAQIRYEFEKFKNDKQQEFSKKVKEIIVKVAKKKGIKAVPRPEMYIYTDLDLTDSVIKELDK